MYNGYERKRTYRLHPPSDVAVITDWRIIVRLMALLTPITQQKCAKIKVITRSGDYVTSVDLWSDIIAME